ncbi:7857_t:CDS:2, partial [Ambispora leptoticha]
DPLAVNNSLIITRNSIVVHNGTDIITSLQYILETEPDLSIQYLENVDVLNNYFPDIAFNDLTFSIEPIEEELNVLPSQPDADIVQIQDTENELKKEADNSKDKIQKIHNNLRKALGPRHAARVWKCAEQIYQLLQ